MVSGLGLRLARGRRTNVQGATDSAPEACKLLSIPRSAEIELLWPVVIAGFRPQTTRVYSTSDSTAPGTLSPVRHLAAPTHPLPINPVILATLSYGGPRRITVSDPHHRRLTYCTYRRYVQQPRRPSKSQET